MISGAHTALAELAAEKTYWVKVSGGCTYGFFEQCRHRMACAMSCSCRVKCNYELTPLGSSLLNELGTPATATL